MVSSEDTSGCTEEKEIYIRSPCICPSSPVRITDEELGTVASVSCSVSLYQSSLFTAMRQKAATPSDLSFWKFWRTGLSLALEEGRPVVSAILDFLAWSLEPEPG